MITRVCDPEHAFLAALMQDIGMLAMLSTMGASYLDILKRAGDNHARLPHWERATLGYTHAEVGAFLAECLEV